MSKEPTKHLVTPPGENINTGTVKTSPSVDAAPLPDPISSAKITSKELATSKVQPVNDTAVEKSITSTPEKVKDFKVVQKTEITKPVPSADTDNQTALSEHDPKRSIKNTTDAKVKSSPDVPAVTVATVTDKTSLSNTKQPVAGGQSEAPTVKANVKTAESQDDPAPPPEPSTVITTVSTPEEKTTQPNSDQPLSQDLSKTPTDKATLTSEGSEEKPVALTKLVSALKAKNEVPLADGGPVEPSVVSTPEQVSECLPKKQAKLEPSPDVDTQTASEQDANKTAKAALQVEVEASPKVPPANKTTLANEETLPKREPVPSGLSEAPTIKADVKTEVKTAEPPTVIRAERATVSTPEDTSTQPNSDQPLSQDLSKTPADKAALTSGGSEEKPVALTKLVSALKAKSEVPLADDAPVEPSVVSTPEQVSECLPKKQVKLEPSPNVDTQTTSEQDANKTAEAALQVEVDSSPKVPPANKTTLANEETLPKREPVLSGLSEVPTVKADVKTTKNSEDPAPLSDPPTVIRAARAAVSTPEDITTPPNSDQPLSQDLSKTPTDKAALTSGGSEEKPVALTKLVSALKAKSEVPLADDAPVEPSVVSTPEQVLEDLPKKQVKLEPSPNVDTQTASEQDANKTVKAALQVEVETSPKVPPAKKTTLANEETLPKREPVPSGLSEAPTVKADVSADVKPVEGSQDPAPHSESATVIRPEKEVVCTPEASNREQPLSQGLSKTPTDKAALTSGGRDEKPVVLPELVSALKAKRDIQSADDGPVEQSFESSPEQASEDTPKNKLVHLEPSPNASTQTSSEQDAIKIVKAAAEVKVDSSPEAPSANKETVKDDPSLPKSMPSVPSGLSEAPSVKADVKSAESQEDPSPLSEPFIVIMAEKVDVTPVEVETTSLNKVKPVSNNSSQSPAPEALLKLAETKEDSSVEQESVSVTTFKSEVQTGVVEQMNELKPQCAGDGKLEMTMKENAEPLPSAYTHNQTSPSEQDSNKIAKVTEIEVESPSQVPSTNKETATNETSPPKSMPSGPNGLSEAPAVKTEVKTTEPPTVIRAEKAAVSTPEDITTPPNSDQPLSQDLSKTPADKATLTSGGSEEKPVALTKLVSALKAKSEVPLADDAPVEPSVVPTPEQVSECLSQKPVKVESSSNIDTQTASEQDANKTATEVEIETSPEVPPSNKSTLTVETTLSKREPAPSGLSEAPAAIADVKSAESQEDSVKTLDSTADLNTNTIIKPEPSTDTNTSPLKQQLEKVTAEIVEEVELESIPDILAPNKETLGNDTSNTETPSDSLPKSPPAETLVKTAERGEDSAAPPEAVLATCAERDVQSLDGDAPVKQSEQATSEHVTKQMPAIKTDEDVQTLPVAGNKDLVHKVIELTDALDVEAPGLESVSKPVDVPEPHLPQDSGLKQPQADNKNSEDLGKIADDLSSTKNHDRLFSNNDICTYCNKIIDGNAKIVFNEPSVICHPKCLKCGVCAKDLGGLEIPMFLTDEAILCVDCYRKA
ncbi:microtubule-associated protein 4 isoform X2 [Oryzias melastigma]|uniref:microtubule-associated protein 4 isoform X2 n=1 Tax=Oryzias melastigma TaxID=30732 RepID=UPI00168D4318|nr:microtubule-associated protein 4 isoform X2 [Oryzias melastigma]